MSPSPSPSLCTASNARSEACSRTDLAHAFITKLAGGMAIPDRVTFDHTALQGLTVVEVAEGRILCELPVSDRVTNRYGTLHGGATATLIDTVSTAALLTACPHSGVSVNLAVTYLAPMPGGPSEVVQVEARVVRVGRQLATLAVELRRKATGVLVAAGTHTKFLEVADPALERMASFSARQEGNAGSREAAAVTGPARQVEESRL